MQQLNNSFYEYYYLTDDGRIYNAAKEVYIAADRRHTFKLKCIDNIYRTISLKSLYRLVYDKNYCIDKIEDLEGEVWKEINNTNSMYYVSNKGRIKSLKGYEAILLKPLKNKQGYYRVDIMQEGKRSTRFIHSLVAAAFLEKPESIDMQIHHKDFNKTNNNVSNLEYLTRQKHCAIHAERNKSIDTI